VSGHHREVYQKLVRLEERGKKTCTSAFIHLGGGQKGCTTGKEKRTHSRRTAVEDAATKIGGGSYCFRQPATFQSKVENRRRQKKRGRERRGEIQEQEIALDGRKVLFPPLKDPRGQKTERRPKQSKKGSSDADGSSQLSRGRELPAEGGVGVNEKPSVGSQGSGNISRKLGKGEGETSTSEKRGCQLKKKNTAMEPVPKSSTSERKSRDERPMNNEDASSRFHGPSLQRGPAGRARGAISCWPEKERQKKEATRKKREGGADELGVIRKR